MVVGKTAPLTGVVHDVVVGDFAYVANSDHWDGADLQIVEVSDRENPRRMTSSPDGGPEPEQRRGGLR